MRFTLHVQIRIYSNRRANDFTVCEHQLCLMAELFVYNTIIEHIVSLFSDRHKNKAIIDAKSTLQHCHLYIVAVFIIIIAY